MTDKNPRVVPADDIAATLRTFIAQRLLQEPDRSRLTTVTRLVSSGLLDSLATVELLAFLDERFGVQIEAHELDWSSMDTIDALTLVVERKRFDAQ